MKKVCVVTTSRAEYGVLRNVINKINNDPYLELCLVVSGTHLSSKYGETISEIEEDCFPIAEKIEIVPELNSTQAILESMGEAFLKFAQMFQRQNPDLLLILGDRYEILPVCCCAQIAQIPIAHISGGETTEGAIDECIRHSVTKMSYLHFPACERYRKRIIQLGEAPERVFNFGDLGVENIYHLEMLKREELKDILKTEFIEKKYFCVTFHPVTLEKKSAFEQITNVLDALNHFPHIGFVFTYANCDKGGSEINEEIAKYVKSHANCIAFQSLGIRRYLSALKYSCGVIGNSSSGIIEAPSLKIPTINIGDRQKGRLQSESIINCCTETKAIVRSIEKALSLEFQETVLLAENPYGNGNTAEKIVETIKNFLQNDIINLKKKFYDVDFDFYEDLKWGRK